MNILPNTIKLFSLLSLFFTHSNLFAQCCRNKPTEYMLIQPTETTEYTDIPNLEQQHPVLHKAPPTKWQQRLTIFKYVGTSMIIAGTGVGAYFLATNIMHEEGIINSSLQDLKSDIGKLHKFTDTTSFSTECPDQFEQWTELVKALLSNCTG